MNIDDRLIRIGSFGAGLSTLMLVSMAFITFPGGEQYPGLSVITAGLGQSAETLRQYRSSLQWMFFLDGLFLVGWLMAWLGLYQFIRPRAAVIAGLTLSFGVAGALCDYTENSIIWGVAQSLEFGQPGAAGWLETWKAVQHLSYWLPWIGAVFASIGLWGYSWLERGVVLVGTLLVVLAAAGLYFPALSMIANIWFLLWFAGLCLLLWRQRMAPQPVKLF